MNGRYLLTILTAVTLAGPVGAQTQMRARMTGGGSGNAGRCYAEVVVDGAAELQVNGDTANLRNLSGAEPQWRRFECTSPMPANADVRLNINGRGRAQLVSSPRNGGPAIVRIEDSKGGAEVYQLEFQWANAYAGPAYGNQGYGYGNQGYGDGNQGYGYGNQGYYDRGMGPERAIQVCRDAIRQEARNRFGTADINFRQINVDDNPGRRDWVVGTIAVRRGWRDEQFPFSCSVNLDNGRVRQARIEGDGGYNRSQGYAARDIPAREMDTCRSAVRDRIGEDRIEFGPMNIDDRYGNDVVRGSARSRGRDYDFSCSVNPYNGNVRDLDLRRR